MPPATDKRLVRYAAIVHVATIDVWLRALTRARSRSTHAEANPLRLQRLSPDDVLDHRQSFEVLLQPDLRLAGA